VYLLLKLPMTDCFLLMYNLVMCCYFISLLCWTTFSNNLRERLI